ncbi:hypothetical protein [Paenibacillus sp. GXUN7292]|uniref:hypothetical protein n=1 Tax=Paenibacillus sp. GXUN7292 TaxID=3422499 RepID=UPI003D7CF66A
MSVEDKITKKTYSLPEHIVAELEELQQQQGITYSDLFRKALNGLKDELNAEKIKDISGDLANHFQSDMQRLQLSLETIRGIFTSMGGSIVERLHLQEQKHKDELEKHQAWLEKKHSAELDSLRKELEQRAEMEKEQLAHTIEQQERDIRAYVEKVELQQNQLTNHETLILEYRSTIANQSADLDKLRGQREENDLLKNKIQSLEADLRETRKELENKEKMHGHDLELARERAELAIKTASAEKVSEYQEKISVIQDKYEKSTAKVQELYERIESMKDESEQQVQQLQEQIEKLKKQ